MNEGAGKSALDLRRSASILRKNNKNKSLAGEYEGKVKKLGLLCALALSVTACATPYVPVPYDRPSANVQNLLVIEDTVPAEATTQKLATNGQNIMSAASSAGLAGLLVGAVAGSIEASVESNQRKRMLAALESQGFDGKAVFDAALEEALTNKGYTIGRIKADRGKTRAFAKLTPQKDAQPGSAILDVAGVSYGYQLVGGKTEWRPFAKISVRMTDPADPARVLLENQVVYNPVATPDVIVNIPPEEEFSFEDIDELEAQPEKAAEGLSRALTVTAQAVAELLQ